MKMGPLMLTVCGSLFFEAVSAQEPEHDVMNSSEAESVVTPDAANPVELLPTIPLVPAQEADIAREMRGRGSLIEEVVVTAQKREESAQSVPLSISAFRPEGPTDLARREPAEPPACRVASA